MLYNGIIAKYAVARPLKGVSRLKKHVEGEIYKVISLCGKSFELRYGYYEDFERESRFSEPIPIYPDFIKSPQYTAEGYPLATQMQEPCGYGRLRGRLDPCCADCLFFCEGEDLIGICKSESRRKKASPTAPVVDQILAEDKQ